MIGLAFSGGKDSWACLLLNKHRLHDILVIWIDTGKNYPELLDTIERAKAMCPNFVTVKVDRDGQNAYHGLPSDIVPVDYTVVGQQCTGKKDVKIQSYLSCCYDNIGRNLLQYCRDNGITELICGQRNDEKHKSTSRNGDVAEGIVRLQPIETWSEEDVLHFVSAHMPLPIHFGFNHSSMDCYDCTAYRKDTKDIAAYRKIHWPLLDKEYQSRKKILDTVINDVLMDN